MPPVTLTVVLPFAMCPFNVAKAIVELVSSLVVQSSVPAHAPVSGPAALITRSVGSINSHPASPLGALLSTLPSTWTYSQPDISTNPPSPESSPPLTSIVASGLNRAFFGESTITSPPSPLRPALAVVKLSELKATTSLAHILMFPPSPSIASAWTSPNWPRRPAASNATCPPSAPVTSIVPVLII
ncbi:hypothetical protein ES703_35737 [subsurface metagenome]